MGTGVKAKLKRVHSPDVHDLAAYRPEGPFGILVQFMIGPRAGPGEEAFDTVVCSPDWLAGHAGPLPDAGEHRLVMQGYDYQELCRQVQDYCQLLDEPTWQDLAAKLGKVGRWEFADYPADGA